MKTAHHARGVSLVEALVALAVLAFGTLGVASLQLSLRQEADLSRHRSEAVRIAQAQLEQARSLAAQSGAGGWASISAQPVPQAVPATAGNAAFRWTAATPLDQTEPPLKAYEVQVEWHDRLGSAQRVALRTHIGAGAAELGGALTVAPAGRLAAPVRDRHPHIPPGAVLQGDGTSRFTPPGSAVGWVFDDRSGAIVQQCSAQYTACDTTVRTLLAGHVRFARRLPPDPQAPDGLPFPLALRVALAPPSAAATVDCFTEVQGSALAYWCALPLPAEGARAWSGTPEWHGLALAQDGADARRERHRICRYAKSTGPQPARTYTGVTSAQVHQNYLVMPAGDGVVAHPCPGGDPADTTGIATWPHQPPNG